MATEKLTDPLGYEIRIEDDRWAHIIDRHPEVEPLRDVLLQTINEPNLIKKDAERADVFYYYRLTGRSVFRRDDIYMSAVVERSEGNKLGRVLTAYLVKQPRKDGDIAWFNLQTKFK